MNIVRREAARRQNHRLAVDFAYKNTASQFLKIKPKKLQKQILTGLSISPSNPHSRNVLVPRHESLHASLQKDLHGARLGLLESVDLEQLGKIKDQSLKSDATFSFSALMMPKPTGVGRPSLGDGIL